jgi:adenylate kinase family enzyme
MIIGPPGAGKSTLAKRMAAITGLPLYHMDQLHFLPGWVEKPKDEFHGLIATIAAR